MLLTDSLAGGLACTIIFGAESSTLGLTIHDIKVLFDDITSTCDDFTWMTFTGEALDDFEISPCFEDDDALLLSLDGIGIGMIDADG
jgi:hypothetical protein